MSGGGAAASWGASLGPLMIAVIGPRIAEGSEGHPTTDPPGCGPVALATLLRLEGRDAELGAIAARFESDPEGRTMGGLREEARRLGVRLVGVSLSERPGDLDRPALVHLDRRPHGHFIVVRPVGHSGTLLQVFDVQGPPVVVDGDALYASPEWTGVALVPTRGARAWRFAAGGIAAVAGLGSWLAMRRMGRR